MKNTEQENLIFGYRMMNLDVPVLEMKCQICGISAKPDFQIRMSPDETGEEVDSIFWDCSKCKMHNVTADDVSILSATIIFERE